MHVSSLKRKEAGEKERLRKKLLRASYAIPNLPHTLRECLDRLVPGPRSSETLGHSLSALRLPTQTRRLLTLWELV